MFVNKPTEAVVIPPSNLALSTLPQQRITVLTLFCLMSILLAAISSLNIGDYTFTFTEILATVGQGVLGYNSDNIAHFVVWELRLPRIVTGILAGAALGMAGAIVQSITRNPLGAPDLMGVSSGASFAVVASFVMFGFSSATMLAFGTLGGFIAGFLTFAIAWKTHLHPLHLTLAGMSIGLFFSAGITVMLIVTDTDTNGIYYWLAGSLMNRTWQHVDQLYLYVIAGLIFGVSFSRPLNLLMLDDMTSRALGLPIHQWRLLLGLTAVLLTAATVAVAGPLAFVGLIAPHIVRFSLHNGSGMVDHKVLLPLAALVGATLITVADWVAKLQTVPVGILCILVGGPLFVYLIHKKGL